jgi:outer membrane protein assembly factor BamA
LALNSGYYFFENAYTDFTIDSFQTSHQVNIKIRIKKYAKQNYFNSDSILYQSHPIYKISNVYIITEAVIGKVKEVIFSDTLKTKENKQVFLFNKALAFKESLMLDNIDLYAGQLYRKDTALHTYKQLLSLGVFKNVIINFLPNDEIDNTIDCYIVCNPLIKQSITSEIEGTNTSGNLGIDGSLLLQNKNLFKGAELIELKLQGSLSAQAQFNNQESSSSNLKNFNQIFNTIQIGPEITFAVPRAFFPFSLLPFNKDKSPRTYIKSSANYQSRPQFNRFITSIDYGFSFRSNANKIKHDIIPFEVYMVRANLSSTFQKDLKAYNDAFLLNSFENHITTLTKYSLTYLSKENTNNNNRPANFIRFTAQSSGNILRQLFELSGESKDAQNRYLILGIPFAQFIKTEIDYRRYVPVRKKSRVVMRIAGGIAKPFTNLTVVPYEQSFFSGGPNSIRAWRARTLGPGSYNPTDSTRFDKIGDILLETNFEYRFHIINSFNGALFVDAGNIWRLNANEDKPKSEFLLNKFADQIAIGAGMGLRWDLNFFVLRLDLAVPIKDPKFAVGNRWTFDKKPFEYLVANFGIGYPF